MLFRVLLLNLFVIMGSVFATPNILVKEVAPVVVATKNIPIEYVAGDFSGQVHKQVRLSSREFSWLQAFDKKEHFTQKIKSCDSSAASTLNWLFSAGKSSDAIKFITPQADEFVVVLLIVGEKNTKKVLIYGSATVCPLWILALVERCSIAATEGWSIRKIGVPLSLAVLVSLVMAKKASSWQSKRRELALSKAITKANAALEDAKKYISPQEGSPNKQDSYGITSLHYAASNGDLTEFTRLLLAGANPRFC